MGKGFDTFMENPHWREFYENAPSDILKERIKIEFDLSPFVMGDGYNDEKLRARHKVLSSKLTKEDVQYLYDEAVGGQEKKLYKQWLDKF